MVCVPTAGACIAGVHYVAVDLPRQQNRRRRQMTALSPLAPNLAGAATCINVKTLIVMTEVRG